MMSQSHIVEVTVNGGVKYTMPDNFNISVKRGDASFESLKSSIALKLSQDIALGYFAEGNPRLMMICDSTTLHQAMDKCPPNQELKIVVVFKDATFYIRENEQLKNVVETLRRENAALKGGAPMPDRTGRAEGDVVDNTRAAVVPISASTSSSAMLSNRVRVSSSSVPDCHNNKKKK